MFADLKLGDVTQREVASAVENSFEEPFGYIFEEPPPPTVGCSVEPRLEFEFACSRHFRFCPFVRFS